MTGTLVLGGLMMAVGVILAYRSTRRVANISNPVERAMVGRKLRTNALRGWMIIALATLGMTIFLVIIGMYLPAGILGVGVLIALAVVLYLRGLLEQTD